MDRNRRILVAEDDAQMRVLLQKVLTREGYDVDVAPNGEVALAMLNACKDYDVLISDIRMPVKNGEQLVPEARRISPTLKIIVISGYAELEQYLRLMQKGAFDYVNKPFKVPDLLDVIDRALASVS